MTEQTAERVFRTLAPTGATPPWEALADSAPALAGMARHGVGEVLGRPELDLRTRQLVTVAVLSALGGADAQLGFHAAGAVRAGADPVEVAEVVAQVAVYAGVPRAINAWQVVSAAVADVAPRFDAPLHGRAS